MMSGKTQNVIKAALANKAAANELIGYIGVVGGFQVNSDATIANVSGDFVVSQDLANPGGYKVRFPAHLNSLINGIAGFTVNGFTPRSPSTPETCVALVTGYNQDNQGWYITCQCATASDLTINPTPPQGFVFGLDVRLTIQNFNSSDFQAI